MPLTVLITGFGRFPGAPHNPSGPLAYALARRRRPAFANTKRIAHVFATSYATVDREVPALIARHRPDVVLMFGLATRTRHLRIEMQARNAPARLTPDIDGVVPARSTIAADAPARLFAPTPTMRLVTGACIAWPVQLSHDAGRYLCNYAY